MDWVALGFLLVPPAFIIAIFAFIMSADEKPQGHKERLPEPTREQLSEAQAVLRRTLAGERFEVFTDEHGRFCYQPVDRGDVKRSSK